MAVMDTTVLWIAGCILYVFLLASLLWHRARAGSVILDLGARNRALWVACTIVFFLVASAAFVKWLGHRAKPIWSTLFYAEMAIFVLILSSGRPQIRENGILTEGRLVPWLRLKSYRWDTSTNTVLIDRQSALPWLRRSSFRVADETAIPKVDAILRTRIAIPLSATSAWPPNRQAD
jgi:hypothetical protein